MFNTKSQKIKVPGGTQVAVFKNDRYHQTLMPGKHKFQYNRNEPAFEFVEINEQTIELKQHKFVAKNAANNKLVFSLDLKFKLENLGALIQNSLGLQTKFTEIKEEDYTRLVDKFMIFSLSRNFDTFDLEKLQEDYENLDVTLATDLVEIFEHYGLKLLDLKATKVEFGLLVATNNTGVLYENHHLAKFLDAGENIIEITPEHKYQFNELALAQISQIVTNQEVLTADNIALRFSYHVVFKLTNPAKLAGKFELHKHNAMEEIKEYIHLASQVALRNQITSTKSAELNSNRQELFDKASQDLKKQFAEIGIEIIELAIRDITFPKMIQDVFAEHLAAEIRAKASLEEARAKVAAARAEKNAAEIIRENPEMKFTLLLQTLKQMSEKGRHSLHIDTKELLGNT